MNNHKLPADLQRLLDWLITQLDFQSCMTGNPALIKQGCEFLEKYTVREVSDRLNALTGFINPIRKIRRVKMAVLQALKEAE